MSDEAYAAIVAAEVAVRAARHAITDAQAKVGRDAPDAPPGYRPGRALALAFTGIEEVEFRTRQAVIEQGNEVGKG